MKWLLGPDKWHYWKKSLKIQKGKSESVYRRRTHRIVLFLICLRPVSCVPSVCGLFCFWFVFVLCLVCQVSVDCFVSDLYSSCVLCAQCLWIVLFLICIRPVSCVPSVCGLFCFWFVFVLWIVYPVSVDCAFLIIPSVFSNVYFLYCIIYSVLSFSFDNCSVLPASIYVFCLLLCVSRINAREYQRAITMNNLEKLTAPDTQDEDKEKKNNNTICARHH